MVKGLPSKTSTDSGSDSRALFSASTSRPTSSHGYKLATKPAPKDDLSADETDYKMLAPQSSPRRSIIVTTKEGTTGPEETDDEIVPAKAVKAAPKKEKDVMDIDSDSDVAPPKKAKPAAVKKAPKEAKKPAAKKAPAPKKVQQSPVAKAYAKRLAKKKVVDSDDEMDALADDILKSPSASESDEPVARKPAARPARRAVATKKTTKYTFEDDDEEDDGGFQDDASSTAFSESE
jgi:DNA topoisomerase-2